MSDSSGKAMHTANSCATTGKDARQPLGGKDAEEALPDIAGVQCSDKRTIAPSSGSSRSKRRSARRGKVLPPPDWSACVYVLIDPHQVHMFRYLLEAQDNLGIMSVVDRWRAALMVRCSPHQYRELLDFLHGMQQTVPFTLLQPFDEFDASYLS